MICIAVSDKKGVLTMVIKDRLNMMDEIKAANESRVKAFLQESKTVKHWKADYAVICNGVYEEDSFIISAANIVEAVNRTTELLEAVAKEFGAEKWSIWDVGIIEQNVF